MWEDRFAASDGYLFGEAPARVLAENPWVMAEGGSALCVADGEGRNSVHLARAGLAVTAFDISPTAVGRAEALAARHGVALEAHVSDWEGWDWDRTFDLVAAIFVQFMGPEDRPRQFETLRQAVRPGGRLVLHGYRPEQVGRGTGGPPSMEQMYTVEMLRGAFGDWQIERLASYEAKQRSGSAHVGMAALIDLVARRLG